jgi:hypothetical protein
MNKLLYIRLAIISISLFSISILCYSTNLIGAYYIHNDITEEIFMLWLIFYCGLLIFYITLFFMKKLKMNHAYVFLMIIIAVFISITYLAMAVVNFKNFDFNMEYYYLLPFTSILGFCMCIVWSFTLPFQSELIITNF